MSVAALLAETFPAARGFPENQVIPVVQPHGLAGRHGDVQPSDHRSVDRAVARGLPRRVAVRDAGPRITVVAFGLRRLDRVRRRPAGDDIHRPGVPAADQPPVSAIRP